MTVEEFARHLYHLRMRAGVPTVRKIASQTGFGKTTISDAFSGRRLPTWDVVNALADALEADTADLREKWVAAKGGPAIVTETPGWLTSVRTDIPELPGARPLEHVCAMAATDPQAALEASWAVVRTGALRLAHSLYGTIPGSWSSDSVDTYGRAEDDSRMPAGSRAVAGRAHHYYHQAKHPEGARLPTTAVVLQIVVMAYRLAWEAQSVVSDASLRPRTRRTADRRLREHPPRTSGDRLRG
ncbi:helix-turn-helix domain-containing protein [[Kitasatospora] papulosa]|uniref:helix-turn-helix domain-containing protein n=1 Tax=[Kitasatospora] papulosa TaxID=1464011 RepID=UPI002E2C3F22|nr:helix-turn-helix transcriptional regulator [[Kitasatospora] papulosa]